MTLSQVNVNYNFGGCVAACSQLSDFMNRQGQSFKETEHSASIIMVFAWNNKWAFLFPRKSSSKYLLY
jgi:hypothetical protein